MNALVAHDMEMGPRKHAAVSGRQNCHEEREREGGREREREVSRRE